MFSLLGIEVAELQARAGHARQQFLLKRVGSIARDHQQAFARAAGHGDIEQSISIKITPGGPQDRRGVGFPVRQFRRPVRWGDHIEADAAVVLQHLHHRARDEVVTGALAAHQQINPAITVPIAPFGLMDAIECREIETGRESPTTSQINIVDQNLGLSIAQLIEAPVEKVKVAVVVDVTPGHTALPSLGFVVVELSVELGHEQIGAAEHIKRSDRDASTEALTVNRLE